jgi:DNA-binding GntR family transcriptional regulator
MKRANEEHHQILEFCRQRDSVQACNLLRQHIEYAGESLKEALERKRAEAQINADHNTGHSKTQKRL